MDSMQLLRKVLTRGYKNHLPIVSTMEITDLCNLRCVHCYIDEEDRNRCLSFEQCKTFIDSIKQLGGLFITITGGEAVLHPEFEKIYKYAFEKGLFVTLFTNGSCFTDETYALFEKYPPYSVEMTLYGFSKATYIRATGVDVFDVCLESIEKLLDRSINLKLKMFVHKYNFSDFSAVYQYAKKKQIPFKFDTFVVCDSSDSRYSHQLSSDEIKTVLDKSSEERLHKIDYDDVWREFIDKDTKGSLFKCGAGKCVCWLKPNNSLRACNFLASSEISLESNSFYDAWNSYTELSLVKENPKSKCNNCSLSTHCSLCPAKAEVLNDDLYMEKEYDLFCTIASYIEEEQP